MSTDLSPAASERTRLSDTIWPDHASGVLTIARSAVLVLAGSLLLTVSAKVNVPLPYVPMTMQTLVVMMLGAAYGPRLGLVTVMAYLAQGAMGLPVFAGPVGGIGYMIGGTGGYLAGFALAVVLVGWLCDRGWDRSVLRMSTVMLLGHVVVVSIGFAWLAFGLNLGVEKAWIAGVVPFIAGSVVKSALGAFLLPAAWRVIDRSRSN